MNQRCSRAVDLGAFVTGGLSEAEHRELSSHLLICPSCEHELANLVPVVALLELAREDQATAGAPVQLRERVLTDLLAAPRSDNALDGSTSDVGSQLAKPTSGADRHIGRRRIFAIAAGLALVAASGAVLAQRGTNRIEKTTVQLEALQKDPLNATVRLATENETTVAEITVTGTVPGEIYFAWFEDPAGKRIGLGSFRGARGTVTFRGQTGIARAQLAAVGASTRLGDKATDRMRAELKSKGYKKSK